MGHNWWFGVWCVASWLWWFEAGWGELNNVLLSPYEGGCRRRLLWCVLCWTAPSSRAVVGGDGGWVVRSCGWAEVTPWCIAELAIRTITSERGDIVYRYLYSAEVWRCIMGHLDTIYNILHMGIMMILMVMGMMIMMMMTTHTYLCPSPGVSF